MIIPTRTQCLSLMQKERVPHHIQRHSQVVTEVALHLTRFLMENSNPLDIQLIESAGLLHDIAKMRCIETGENHAKIGAEMLQSWGYSLLSPIVEEHILLESHHLEGPITESLIVNYADKRVKHDEIVLLEERFLDLMERYGRTSKIRDILEERFELYLKLEDKIFDHIPIEPNDLLRLPLNH